MRTPPTTDPPAAARSAAPVQVPAVKGGKTPNTGGKGQDRRRGSKLAVRNWRVRTRLVALVMIPTVTAIALGGLRVELSVRSALTYHRIHNLAVLSGDVTGLAQALEDERDTTAVYIASGRPSGGAAAVRKQYAVSDRWAGRVRAAAAGAGSGTSAGTGEKLQVALARIGALTGLRDAAVNTQQPPLPVVTEYSQYIADLFSLNDEIAQGSSDPGLTDSVRTLGSMSRMKDQASQQRAMLSTALIAGQFQYGLFDALTNSIAQQSSGLAAFQTSAPLAETEYLTNTVTGTHVDDAQNMEQRAVVLGRENKPLDLGMKGSAASQQWYAAMSDTVGRMRTVEKQLVNSIIAQSGTLERNAIRSAVIFGGVVLLVLLLVLIVTTGVARSMVRPLRRLRSGALEVAGQRLPEAVRRLDETDGASGRPEIEPIGVDSADEIGEVARAFDQVHREALRLAADEAMLRGSVNGMFVNLSRRSQTLVERQLRLIDRLEQTEQDPSRLGSLFQMDHLATRMRRNSENLLVLAGHEEAARRWTESAPLVDVLRAAVSEIEQYERVTVDVQPGLALRGPAVSDAVHLLSEIVENATSFSAGDTRVTVTGRSLSSGGFLLEITDSGVGMAADELAHANWRLDNPPVVDVSVSRRMGLFVVGRLAAKHNIRVRLRPSESGGLTALVWIPDSLIVPHSDRPGAWQRRAEITPAGSAAQASAAEAAPAATAASAAAAAPAALPRRPLSGEAMSRLSLAGPVTPPDEAPGERRGREEMRPAPDTPAHAPAAAAADQRPARGQPPALTPAAGMPKPVTPAGGFPALAAPPMAIPPMAIPPAATPPTATPPTATPPTGFPPAMTPPPGLPAPRIPGTGPSPHCVMPGYDQQDGREAAMASWTGPHTAPVVVPETAVSKGEQRLPIFDSVESEWFRRGHGSPPDNTSRDPDAGTPPPPPTSSSSWSSPADEGWSAARAAEEPSVGALTAAGLPRRIPQANAVPGSVATKRPPAQEQVRSPETARTRMENFQQGVRQARAALATEERPDD